MKNSKILLINKNPINLIKGKPKSLHITYLHNSHKRLVSNADIFFQIFTCYILGIIFEGSIIYNNSWKYSKIISFNFYKNSCVEKL